MTAHLHYIQMIRARVASKIMSKIVKYSLFSAFTTLRPFR